MARVRSRAPRRRVTIGAMRVVIAGGTGFLGRALVASLAAAGHDVPVLTRRPRPGRREIAWTPDGATGPWAASLAGVDAVVNLAGEGIADRRWTASRKRALVESRVLATSSLVEATLGLARPPRVFVSGSGVGSTVRTATSWSPKPPAPATDFVATMAVAWEQAAAPVARGLPAGDRCARRWCSGPAAARSPGCCCRSSSASAAGSARASSGCRGSSVADWVALVERLIADDAATGAFNLAAPEPVRNAEFTKALGRVLHRPTVLPVPAAALTLALGELSDVLLTGQRAVPARPPRSASRSATRASTTPSPPRSEGSGTVGTASRADGPRRAADPAWCADSATRIPAQPA